MVSNCQKSADDKRMSFYLLIVAFIWGNSYVASKICINSGMRTFEILFIRFLFGAILIFIIFHKTLMHPSKTAIHTGIILGLLCTGIYALETLGLSLTEATKTSFLISTNIVMMPFFYALFCGVRPTKYSVLAALFATAGVGFLTLTNGLSAFAIGDLLLLIAAAGYCINNILIYKRSGGDSRIQITFFQFITMTVCFGCLTSIQGASGAYRIDTIVALVYLSVVSTVLAFILRIFAMRYVNPMRASLILATQSVFCAIVSALLLHERLTPQMLIGIVLICGGILTEILHPVAKPESSE